jgi:hypothetical protein
MTRKMMRAKIHRATVTQADVDYEGSITIDRTLMDATDLLPNEAVCVWNVTNGNRFETYVVEGERDSGCICVNGAAAHLVNPGRPRHHRRVHVAAREEGAEARAEGRLRGRGQPHPREAEGSARAAPPGLLMAEARDRDITQNRRAFHDYHIDERIEAGSALIGSR